MKIPKAIYDKHNYNIAGMFCAFMFIGIIITAAALAATHGGLFCKIFWWDLNDTGMDFFHSIEYVRGRAPYEGWQTLYPPLANFIFYMLYRFVPLEVSQNWADTFSGSLEMKMSWYDLRLWQSTAILFIFFILITSITIIGIVQKYLSEYGAQGFWVGVAVLSSYGLLYAYERGNIVIVALICTMFFVFFKDSPNKIIRELALISLAIAAGIKLYPAFFGFLLIYDKQFVKALRTILYGIVFFVAPVFIFHEGLYGIKLFFEVLFSFTSVDTLAKAAEGFSFTQIMASIILLLHNMTGFSVNEELLLSLLPKISLIISAALLFCGFKVKKNWQRTLVCCTAMLLYSFQYYYAIIFLLIPLLVMIKEDVCLRRKNIVAFIFLIFSQMLLPVSGNIFRVWTLTDFRLQVCIITFVILIICSMSGKVDDGKLCDRKLVSFYRRRSALEISSEDQNEEEKNGICREK